MLSKFRFGTIRENDFWALLVVSREEDNHNEEVTRNLQAQLESEVSRQQSLAILKQQKFLALQ